MSEHDPRALALAKKIEHRASFLATEMERTVMSYGIVKTDMRAIMLAAVGRALIERSLELEKML